jgi:hypothetical protein
MLATSEFESSEHFENPPNLLIWFYILKLKQNKNIWLLAAWKCFGLNQHAA